MLCLLRPGARDPMVRRRGPRPATDCTNVGHPIDPRFRLQHIHPPSAWRHWLGKCEPLAGLFHQLTPGAFKNRSSAAKGLDRSIYFAFRGSKWLSRQAMLLRRPVINRGRCD